MSFLQGVIGNVLKQGGNQAKEYYEKEADAERRLALEAARSKIDEDRATRLEEARERRAREDKIYWTEGEGAQSIIRGAKLQADAKEEYDSNPDRVLRAEAAARRAFELQLDFKTHPDYIEQQNEADRLKDQGKPIPVAAGTDLIDPKTGKVIYSNRNVRGLDDDGGSSGGTGGRRGKLSEAYKEEVDRIKVDENEITKHINTLELKALEAENPQVKTDVAERIKAKQVELNQLAIARHRAGIRHGYITPQSDAERVSRGISSEQDLQNVLRDAGRMGGEDYAEKVEQALRSNPRVQSQIERGKADLAQSDAQAQQVGPFSGDEARLRRKDGMQPPPGRPWYSPGSSAPRTVTPGGIAGAQGNAPRPATSTSVGQIVQSASDTVQAAGQALRSDNPNAAAPRGGIAAARPGIVNQAAPAQAAPPQAAPGGIVARELPSQAPPEGFPPIPAASPGEQVINLFDTSTPSGLSPAGIRASEKLSRETGMAPGTTPAEAVAAGGSVVFTPESGDKRSPPGFTPKIRREVASLDLEAINGMSKTEAKLADSRLGRFLTPELRQALKEQAK